MSYLTLISKKIINVKELSLNIIEEYSNSNDIKKIVKACKSPNVPIEILERHLFNTNYLVRMAIAGNPNTPSSMLEHIAEIEKRSNKVKTVLIQNPNTPLTVLSKLENDADFIIYVVFIFYLKNRNKIPLKMAEAIVRHKSANVRGYAISVINYCFNDDFPEKKLELMTELYNNANPKIFQLVDNFYVEFLCNLLINPKYSEEKKKDLIKDERVMKFVLKYLDVDTSFDLEFPSINVRNAILANKIKDKYKEDIDDLINFYKNIEN